MSEDLNTKGRLSTIEKIALKKAEIDKLKDTIKKCTDKISKLESEIKSLEQFEIRNLINEIGVPIEELSKMLNEIKIKTI